MTTMVRLKIFFVLVLLVFVCGIYALGIRVRDYTAAQQQQRQEQEQQPRPSEDMLYSSEDGVSFSYPPTYELSSRTDGNAERSWDVLLLLPKGYVPPQNGEGAPAISMGVFPNPEGATLEQWVKGDARSNWKLGGEEAGGLKRIRVNGVPAVSYRHSGLYETDVVAMSHNGKIFMFEAGWLTAADPIRADFEKLITTVHFTQ